MTYDPRYVYLYPASIPQIVAHIQEYLRDNPITSTATITQLIINELSEHPEILNGAEIPITAEDQQSIKDYIDHLPSVDGYTKEQVNALLDEKQDVLTFDQAPTPSSSNPVTSSGISTAITTAITTLSALINLKANLSDVYTKSVIDQLLSGKANVTDVYTKTVVDTLLGNKANAADVYTKIETNQLLTAKANAADVYTKTETDTLLNDKADETEVTDLKSAFNQMQYEVAITSVTDSTPQHVPFFIEKGSSITVKTADGNAFTNATFYAFDSSKIEIGRWSLPSSSGNQRTFLISSEKDCYTIRILNNDGASRDYIVADNNKLTAKDLNKIQSYIDALNGKAVSTMNCNTDLAAGRYRVSTMSGTLPDGFSSSNVVLENNVYDGWVIQKIYRLMRPDDVYVRYVRISNPQYVWHKLIDGNGAKSGANIDQILITGNYTVSNPTGTLPEGYDSSIAMLLNVSGFGENGNADNTPRYFMQKLCAYNNPSTIYTRIIDKVSSSKTDWYAGTGSGGSSLTGKKIVCFGDSITGNFQSPNDYPSMIAAITGATVYNSGVGGSTLAAIESEARVAFSFVKLVDSIVADDYTAQENSGLQVTYATESESGFVDTGIDYIPTRISTLKSINWEEIDYITIAYGTNDWSNGHTIDNANDSDDTTTVLGALRYSLDKLLTAYPQLKVLVISPTWRFDPGSAYKDSDTWQLYGNYLYEIADGEINVCKQFHFHMYNQYYECGFNKQNRFQYFFSNDGTHPKLYGRQTMATKIANELLYSVAR